METNRAGQEHGAGELLCPDCLITGKRVAYTSDEQLKRHLCRAHYDCLAYACPLCEQRHATHRELDEHLHGAHPQQAQADYRPDPLMSIKRRKVNQQLNVAMAMQMGLMTQAVDDNTIITRAIGSPPAPAAVDGVGGVDARQEDDPVVPRNTDDAAVTARLRATPARNGRQQTRRAENVANVAPAVPAVEAPRRAIPPPQMAAPAQLRPIDTRRGGFMRRGCRECEVHVEDTYPALRGHALSHVTQGAEQLAGYALQDSIGRGMDTCFPNCRVRNDMTCNSVGCWEDVTPASRKVGHAALLQSTHVQERHFDPAELKVRCPVEECADRNQSLPSLKALRDHISAHHGGNANLDAPTRSRYIATEGWVKAKTAVPTQNCFPFTPSYKRSRRRDPDEEA